jgi:hypothetical protein
MLDWMASLAPLEKPTHWIGRTLGWAEMTADAQQQQQQQQQLQQQAKYERTLLVLLAEEAAALQAPQWLRGRWRGQATATVHRPDHSAQRPAARSPVHCYPEMHTHRPTTMIRKRLCAQEKGRVEAEARVQ